MGSICNFENSVMLVGDNTQNLGAAPITLLNELVFEIWALMASNVCIVKILM